MSTESINLDLESSRLASSITSGRKLRSRTKWYEEEDKPPDDQFSVYNVYTKEDWEECLETYRGYSQAEKRLEFDQKIEEFHRIFTQEAEPNLKENFDLGSIITTLLRRWFRIKFLFDWLDANNDDIGTTNVIACSHGTWNSSHIQCECKNKIARLNITVP